jgi:hypothetical protein
VNAIHLEASRRVEAAPSTVYAILRDYHDAHRRIVSPKGFLWLRPEKGGVGAGTELRFAIRVLGRTEEYRGDVSEPEPGRVLLEDYPERRSWTRFVVDPAGGGTAAQVTIVTEAPGRGGVAGWLERILATRVLLPLYHDELARLADIAEGRHLHEPVPLRPKGQ